MRRGVLELAVLAIGLAAPGGVRAQTIADYDYTNLGFRGAGPTYGYIWPTKVRATPLYGLRLDLGYLGPGLRIAPTLLYWSSSMRRGELEKLATRINALPALRRAGVTLTGADMGSVHMSDLALDIDGQVVVTTPGGLLTYAGAGIGLHALSGRGDAIEDTFVEDLLDTVAPAISGMAGVELSLAERLRVFWEMRLTAMGDVQYAGLRIGGALMTGGRR